jgi:hypothetical protein
MTKRISMIGSSSAAVTVPGWNDYEHKMFERRFLEKGVIQGIGSAFAVTERGAGANMTVDVAAGAAIIEITNSNLAHGKTYKVYFDSDATENIAVPTADGTNERIDIIVLRVDVSVDPDGNAGNVAIIELVEGTPAGSPSAPATPSNAIKLAEISVPASDTTITDSQITDSRTYVTVSADVLADLARSSETAAIRSDSVTWLGTLSGTNTLTAGATPAPTAYAAGQRFAGIIANDNTSAVTVNIDSLGAKDLLDATGAALASGDIVQDGIIEFRYDGTQFLLTSPTAGGSGTVVTLETDIRGANSGVNIDISSTSFVDIDATDLTDSIVCGADDILEITFNCRFSAINTTPFAFCYLDLYVGSARIGDSSNGLASAVCPSSTDHRHMSFTARVKPGAGTHTIRPQAKVDSSTMRIHPIQNFQVLKFAA